MPTLTLLGSPAISDVFYNLNFLETATIIASSATSLTMEAGLLTFTVTGTGFTLTNIGGKDYLATGTVEQIAMDVGGIGYFDISNLTIDANLFRDTILADEGGTDNAALEDLFRTQVYDINGTVGGDFQSQTQLSLDGASLKTTGANFYFLFGGNDTITAGSGNDSIFGGNERDSIRGGNGNDLIFGGEHEDTLRGDNGSDTIEGDAGADRLFGGDGNDTLFGEDDADRLYGGADADQINGGFGEDRVFGGSGGDVLAGDEDRDTVFGDSGDDLLDGGDARDFLDAGTGSDTVYGGDGNDVVLGGDGEDDLFGFIGNDALFGGADADSLWGNDGRDLLVGGTGDDTMFGEGGADTLTGGAGADLMYGGVAADRFVFAALSDMGIGLTRDLVLDFTSGTDMLDFAGLGLTFVTGAFTGANQIRFDGLTRMLQIDTDGNLAADLEIELQAGAVVVAGDLILV